MLHIGVVIFTCNDIVSPVSVAALLSNFRNEFVNRGLSYLHTDVMIISEIIYFIYCQNVVQLTSIHPLKYLTDVFEVNLNKNGQ